MPSTFGRFPMEELAKQLLPFARSAGFDADASKMLAITPLIQERLTDFARRRNHSRFLLRDELPPYDSAELIPQKGDAAMAATVLERAREILTTAEFSHDALDAALRAGAAELKVKTGQMFQPIRVAVCGRKVAPPLFGRRWSPGPGAGFRGNVSPAPPACRGGPKKDPTPSPA